VVNNIYSNRFTDPGTARQNALAQLGKNTEHWSDEVNLAVDDTHMVRITVTYLDPVLIQYLVLNYLLNDSNLSANVNDLNSELMTTMNRLGGRNEMLFIVTITSPFYSEQAYNATVLTVRMPTELMGLVSAADIRVTPVHEDHILDENIDITHGPVSGILGFPLAVLNQTQCIWVVDQWTNSLTLDIPTIVLGTTTFNAPFWNIPYRALVMEDNNPALPALDPNFDWNRTTPVESPPTPSWIPNSQIDNTNRTQYWEDMGRYLWNFVITESHH